ncbi:MAG: hypothetical protein J0M08_13660 [Bacteroidetes bacterium]|nr:hypothetical protein [Bacteroidota bacterium]
MIRKYVFLFAIFPIVVSSQTSSNSIDVTLEKGISLLADKKKEEACICFYKSKELGSKKAQSYYDDNFCADLALEKYKDGRTKLNLKQYEEAMPFFNDAIALAGDSAAYNKRGLCNFMLSNYDSALADFSNAIKVAATNASYYHHRAQVWLAKNEYQQAFDDCSESIKLNPKGESAYFTRAAAEEAMTQQNAALFDYSEILRINPANAIAYYKRAVLKESFLNDRKASCEDYNKAFELGYEDAQENVNLCKKIKKK